MATKGHIGAQLPEKCTPNPCFRGRLCWIVPGSPGWWENSKSRGRKPMSVRLRPPAPARLHRDTRSPTSSTVIDRPGPAAPLRLPGPPAPADRGERPCGPGAPGPCGRSAGSSPGSSLNISRQPQARFSRSPTVCYRIGRSTGTGDNPPFTQNGSERRLQSAASPPRAGGW